MLHEIILANGQKLWYEVLQMEWMSNYIRITIYDTNNEEDIYKKTPIIYLFKDEYSAGEFLEWLKKVINPHVL